MRCIVAGMIASLALAFAPASAFAQAAAESVMLNANSAAATAKAGHALSSSLDRANRQIAGRVQRLTSQPASGKLPVSGKMPVKENKIPTGATLAPGPVVTSIQGNAALCAPTGPPRDQTAAQSQTNCAGRDSADKPAPQKYKSVVTVSF